MKKTIDLDIQPKYDHIEKFLLEKQELPEIDKLYTPAEMKKLGYASIMEQEKGN